MREIKFRAWYKPFKDNDFGAGYKYGNNVISFHDMSAEKYEVEQYTGFKDFGGDEIYEGDILTDIDNGFVVGSVSYRDGSYWCSNDLLIDCLDCAVVGNIHTDKKLLEDD